MYLPTTSEGRISLPISPSCTLPLCCFLFSTCLVAPCRVSCGQVSCIYYPPQGASPSICLTTHPSIRPPIHPFIHPATPPSSFSQLSRFNCDIRQTFKTRRILSWSGPGYWSCFQSAPAYPRPPSAQGHVDPVIMFVYKAATFAVCSLLSPRTPFPSVPVSTLILTTAAPANRIPRRISSSLVPFTRNKCAAYAFLRLCSFCAH